MSKQVDDFKTDVLAAFNDVKANLDNIVADEAKLAKQISDLQDRLENGPLSESDKNALDTVAALAREISANSKAIADAVPDVTVPEPPPTPPVEPPTEPPTV